MAHAQSRRRALPDGDNKENQPPKKPHKPQTSANDLLKKSKSKHRSVRDVLAPLPGGISKKARSPQAYFFKRFSKNSKRQNSDDDPLRAVPGFFGKIKQDKHQERALDTGYAGAAHAYCEGAAAEAKKRVDHRQAELEARRKGLDLDGQPLRRKGHPTQADFDSMFAQMKGLAKPLEDEMIDVEFRDPVSGKSQVRQLRIGNTLDKFFDRHTRKQAAVKEISGELREVEAEMAVLVEEIRAASKGKEKANAEKDAEMAELQKEMDDVEKQYKADIKALRRELKAQSEEVNKKIAELKAFVS